MKCMVSISDMACLSLILSAIESYRIVDSGRDDNLRYLEAYGNLWGYEVNNEIDGRVIRVSFVDVDLSAKRESDRVTPTGDAYEEKKKIISSICPELEYLGFYHSHPYSRETHDINSELAVQRHNLYEFSEGDKEHSKGLRKNRSVRISLVVTVFERENVSRNDMYMNDKSAFRYQIDEKTLCWIKVYAWYRTINNSFRRYPGKDVTLRCAVMGFANKALYL